MLLFGVEHFKFHNGQAEKDSTACDEREANIHTIQNAPSSSFMHWETTSTTVAIVLVHTRHTNLNHSKRYTAHNSSAIMLTKNAYDFSLLCDV